MRNLKLVAYGGLLLTLAGVTFGHVADARHAQPANCQSADIRVRRLDIVDAAKPSAHVWAVSGQGWSAYASLSSRHLRNWLSHQQPGTRIWLDMDPAAPIYVGQPDPNATKEIKDFSAFCKAHQLYFSVAPVA